MNILFISHLSGWPASGPTYSVPAQIGAQAKLDHVYWWNLTEPELDAWKQTGVFHNRKDQPRKKISALPAPFHHPDIVVFEDFYYLDDCFLAAECRARRIPYVIVPRSALTKTAQEGKKLKKQIANLLLFRPMARGAAAIQYLTESELQNSGSSWCKRGIVIPNGMVSRDFTPGKPKNEGCRGVFIGRFMPQKGLDLLLDAVVQTQELLRRHQVSIDLYGPSNYALWGQVAEEIQHRGLADLLHVYDAVVDTQKAEVLEHADFFIMTSRFEGMPMGLIEALSYSLPCLVTEGTNMAPQIQQAQAGWTCENTTSGIVEAIQQMCADLPNMEVRRKNAHALSCDYHWDAIAQQTHQIFLELLSSIK